MRNHMHSNTSTEVASMSPEFNDAEVSARSENVAVDTSVSARVSDLDTNDNIITEIQNNLQLPVHKKEKNCKVL